MICNSACVPAKCGSKFPGAAVMDIFNTFSDLEDGDSLTSFVVVFSEDELDVHPVRIKIKVKQNRTMFNPRYLFKFFPSS